MYILNPNNASPNSTSLDQAKYSYHYPMNMKLKPGSEQHGRIVSAILERASKSHNAISNRYDTWNKLDQTLTAYIPLDDKEKAVQNKDSRRPVSTVVPVSYALLETLLTFLTTTFLRSPIFRYEGMGPEDMLGAKLLETVVEAQVQRFKAGLAIHTALRDSLIYGFGGLSPMWTQTTGYKTRKEELGFMSSISNLFKQTGTRKVREEVILFEGNEFSTIDPYMTLPDPSYSIHDVQKAGFLGWVRKENLLDMLNREEYNSNFFNAKYVQHTGGKSIYGEDVSKRDKDSVRGGQGSYIEDQQNVDVIYMYIRIIPKQWGLGNLETPERWLFGLAADSVLVAAGPTNLDHGMTPVGICAPEYDGYSAVPLGRLEVVQGMQTFVDFLYNSHMTNVRKAINNMFVVDPELINMNDLRSPSAGKYIRLRREAWGKGVDGAIKQLDIMDITKNHMGDMSSVTNIIERMLGTPDSLQGVLTPANDRSATEFHETRNSALGRLEKVARIASLQLMHDIGYMIASQTQQFMSSEQYFRLVGETAVDLARIMGKSENDRTLISPMDILVDYDIIVNDGSIPSTGNANAWAAMFQVISGNEALMGQFDAVRIFQYWATLQGARNVSDFVKSGATVRSNVMPDAEVEAQAQAGNIIPLDEARREAGI